MKVSEPVILHFEDAGSWHSLPDWAEYFVSLGRQMAAEPQPDSQTVTAIVLPTRAFAAAFISLGMVISDAASRDEASDATHFERLFDLPQYTPVIYRPRPGVALMGLMREPEERDGKIWIRVQVNSKEGGGLTYNVDESHALQVQPAGGRSWKLPKTQTGKSVRTANKFVDSLLGDADPVQLGLRSKVVCAIVGRRNVLEHEIRQTPLAIHVNGKHHAKGQLQDILRVNRFVTAQQSHRSALITVGGSPPSAEFLGTVEAGIVFDGAVGFLKWGAMCRGRNQVVILDRTEPYFDDAIAAINTRFSQDGTHDGCLLPEGEAPSGSEFLAFREARQ